MVTAAQCAQKHDGVKRDALWNISFHQPSEGECLILA